MINHRKYKNSLNSSKYVASTPFIQSENHVFIQEIHKYILFNNIKV